MGDDTCEFKTFVRKSDETLHAVLNELNQTPGVRGSIIFYSDGVIKDSLLPKDIDSDRIGARIGILTGTGQNVSDHVKLGKLDTVYLNSSEGIIITTKIGPSVFLSALIKQGANMGVIGLALDRAKKKIRVLL
jgi:predicted regulator of Ras-like GTPase activity (Roadblock/LC7/MglB family)